MDDLLLAILLASSPHWTHVRLPVCDYLKTYSYMRVTPHPDSEPDKGAGRAFKEFPEGLRFCLLLLLLVSPWQRVPVFTGAC